MNKRIILISTLLILGISSRLIPHYPNFTAVGAVALLSGAMLTRSYINFLLPLLTLFISDIIINNLLLVNSNFILFYEGALFTYLAVFLATWIGFSLKSLNMKSYSFAAVGSMVIFFLFTNFGVWYTGVMYPKTPAGLMAAYSAAIPFAITDLAGMLFYGFLITSAYKAVSKEKLTQFARV